MREVYVAPGGIGFDHGRDNQLATLPQTDLGRTRLSLTTSTWSHSTPLSSALSLSPKMLRPVFASMFMSARWTGAAPRYRGRSDGWTFSRRSG